MKQLSDAELTLGTGFLCLLVTAVLICRQWLLFDWQSLGTVQELRHALESFEEYVRLAFFIGVGFAGLLFLVALMGSLVQRPALSHN